MPAEHEWAGCDDVAVSQLRDEQLLFLDAIRNDRNMDSHVEDAINSLRIVLAADHSVRTGEVVKL